jgi:hypothetical protein
MWSKSQLGAWPNPNLIWSNQWPCEWPKQTESERNTIPDPHLSFSSSFLTCDPSESRIPNLVPLLPSLPFAVMWYITLLDEYILSVFLYIWLLSCTCKYTYYKMINMRILYWSREYFQGVTKYLYIFQTETQEENRKRADLVWSAFVPKITYICWHFHPIAVQRFQNINS